MRSDLDDRVDALASTQLGILARHHVLHAGGSDHYIDTCVQRKRWQLLHPGVYLTGSAPPTWLQRQLAACWAAGPQAVASHRGAAAVWWLDGATEGPIEILVPERADERWLREQVLQPIVYYCDSTGMAVPGCAGMFASLFRDDKVYCVRAATVIAWACAELGIDVDRLEQEYGLDESEHAAPRA